MKIKTDLKAGIKGEDNRSCESLCHNAMMECYKSKSLDECKTVRDKCLLQYCPK